MNLIESQGTLEKAAVRHKRERLLFASLSILLFAVPIALVEFPPATDLPQHLAQVRLFFETLGQSGGPYIVQWANPNNLIYFIMAAGWPVVSPGLLGRLTLWLIVLAWVAGVHFVAFKMDRPLEQAVWSSLFVYNHAFYWGFLNFLVGLPVFLLWFLLNIFDKGQARLRNGVLFFLITILLYESHALWLGMGIGWLLVFSLVRKTPWKAWLRKAAGLLPIMAFAVFWYPRLASSRAVAGFDVAAHWFTPPLRRLSPDWLVDGFLGGIKGPWESAILLLLFLWCGLGIFQHRKELKEWTSKPLLVTAAFFLVIALLSPDKYMNTINFASRWLPVAAIFLVLALPPPNVRPAAGKLVSLGLVAFFCLTTAVTWEKYENVELAGLPEALARVPEGSLVLGLDYVKTSSFVKNRPFIQIFSYAQALKGGEGNFSFAEHSSGIVAYRSTRPRLWTPGLEWLAERAKKSDIEKFDFVLINGTNETHQEIAATTGASCLTCIGRWRLYSGKKH